MSPLRTIIIFGTGPGIGNHVATKFASEGFTHVVLLARNSSRLENEDAPFVAQASLNVKVDSLRLDLSDLDSIPGVLKRIDDLAKGDDVEVVFFNAARIKPSGVLDVSVEEIDEDFKVTNLALYIIAQHYIPRLQSLAKSSPTAKPSFIVTNSHLPWDPVPQLLSLSLTKASQRNMVQSFSRAFSESGIHSGLVSVEGVVAPGNKHLSPTNIAEKAWEFFEKGVEGGLEVNIKE
ncbi:NAD(P)-binding protein [Massarina eburnea CBS 473.64]|uniref:NAD(P)-binding protein n=1 Tax=Massarina eburnea CBS 473.64 TaxID=1395130 RepID=A0A6A6RYD6_9PLEO|nr:NAD(P)-binding protein [Massarina eburnea CBS 473.64]